MKKTISIIVMVMAIGLSSFAQDGRQRTVQTIVSDVLAQMPPANAADNNAQMKDLAASAPESVVQLAGMLQSAEKGANNLIEYAISGVCRFAAAPENRAAYLDKVRAGLEKGIAACKDAANKQYLESELHLMEAAPAPQQPSLDLKETVAKAGKLAKSALSKDNCEALYLYDKVLGADAVKIFTKTALKTKDHATRMKALEYLSEYADEGVFATIVKKFKSLSTEGKQDVLGWLGDNKVSSQIPFILAQFNDSSLTSQAIKAAGKIGGDSSVVGALISQLGTDNGAVALQALKSYKDDISEKVIAALDGAKGGQLSQLVSLAGTKHMTGATSKLISLCKSADNDIAGAAVKALAGTVGAADVASVASLLDAAASADAGLSRAYAKTLSSFSADESYAKVSSAIASAKNPARFYPALAASGTASAIKDLYNAYKSGSKDALEALKTAENYAAAPYLLEAAAQDEGALSRYVQLVSNNEGNIDSKADKLANALKLARTDAVKNQVFNALAGVPTLKSFVVASTGLDNNATAPSAALAVKDIAGKSKDDIDAGLLRSVLQKAIDALSATGDADHSYAVDEIKQKLSAVEEPSPIFTLSSEEKKQGFEVLFDGTDLDKWIGNKEGYRIVNNNIYVTAGYGNAGNLYTEKEYKDFVLRFEFSFVRPGANNGVGVRAPLEGDAAYVGMCEVQVLDHDDPIYANLREYQVHGSVYGVIPAKRIVHKPLGEWGTEEIRVKGNHITVTVNGEVIVDGDVKEACQGHNVAPDGSNNNPYTVDHRNHPGMFNPAGHIGFLGHGAGVRFRNVRVLDLSKRK